ncbi:MAG: 2'-5' RNA ligase family protein [Leptospiraceae bacterium]|nr:2'-5' RNA ligase family protein [Leptospiraceae bacterium]MDW8306100.1 2'-5' RNA ligase family protein [Leptospiraceae bacterium]
MLELPRKSSVQAQPWYKLHLTVHFWPSLSRAEFFEVLHFLRKFRDDLKPRIFCQISGFDVFQRAGVLYLCEKSPQVRNLKERLLPLIQQLPSSLQGETQRPFVPHWTVLRRYDPYWLTKPPSFLEKLKDFYLEGYSPALEFYFSAYGIYEAHSLFL